MLTSLSLRCMMPVLTAFSISACATTPPLTAPGTAFRDCPDCPELVIVPAGRFQMGSPPAEPGRFDDEGPVHEVTIARPLAVMRMPVTVAQFARFAAATALAPSGECNVWNEKGDWHKVAARTWRDPGFAQQDDHPVVCVSWDEGQAFANWLSTRTGQRYRFLSEAEFEYAARGGASTAFPGAPTANISARTPMASTRLRVAATPTGDLQRATTATRSPRPSIASLGTASGSVE